MQANEPTRYNGYSEEGSAGNGESATAANMPQMRIQERVIVDEFKVSPESLMAQVEKIINQGNIHRIVIQSDTGEILLDLPINGAIAGGLTGAVAFPVVGAIAAVGTLLSSRPPGRVRPDDLAQVGLIGSAIGAGVAALVTGLGLAGAMAANLTVVIERCD
jgi:hypothetical protein